MNIKLSDTKELPLDQVIHLNKANHWSSAEKPELLIKALNNSHSLISAWEGDKLIGLGNSISDGYLVVYFPHMLVLPEYQNKGIGSLIINRLKEIYKNYHQQMLVADGKAISFYKSAGFNTAHNCEAMWIYAGNDH